MLTDLIVFRDLVARLGENAGTFQELYHYHNRRERLGFWALVQQPFNEMPQIVFALRAVQRPASIPVSLASLNLITHATSSFSWKVYKVFQQTGMIADSVSAVRELYQILEVPNKVPDGTKPFPEYVQTIRHGVSLEFR